MEILVLAHHFVTFSQDMDTGFERCACAFWCKRIYFNFFFSQVVATVTSEQSSKGSEMWSYKCTCAPKGNMYSRFPSRTRVIAAFRCRTYARQGQMKMTRVTEGDLAPYLPKNVSLLCVDFVGSSSPHRTVGEKTRPLSKRQMIKDYRRGVVTKNVYRRIILKDYFHSTCSKGCLEFVLGVPRHLFFLDGPFRGQRGFVRLRFFSAGFTQPQHFFAKFGKQPHFA